jgi:hypothetical protein
MLREWPGRRAYSGPGRVAVVGNRLPRQAPRPGPVAPERVHDLVHQWPYLVVGQAAVTLKCCTEGVQRRPVQPKPPRLCRIIPRRQQHRFGLPGRVRVVAGHDAMVAHAEGYHDEWSVGDPPSQAPHGRRVVNERPHSFGICPPGRRPRLVPQHYRRRAARGAGTQVPRSGRRAGHRRRLGCRRFGACDARAGCCCSAGIQTGVERRRW